MCCKNCDIKNIKTFKIDITKLNKKEAEKIIKFYSNLIRYIIDPNIKEIELNNKIKVK
jgi:uncharacterized membrane protein